MLHVQHVQTVLNELKNLKRADEEHILFKNCEGASSVSTFNKPCKFMTLLLFSNYLFLFYCLINKPNVRVIKFIDCF